MKNEISIPDESKSAVEGAPVECQLMVRWTESQVEQTQECDDSLALTALHSDIIA